MVNADRARAGPRFAGHDPKRGHDTAGVAWAGRTVTASDSDDRGEADPLVRRLLLDGGPRAWMAALATARLLSPLLAAATDDGASMASVVVAGPDEEPAAVAFTGLDALARWHPQARPVPVSAAVAAQAALGDGVTALVVDPGSEHARLLRMSMMTALAEGRPWVPPAEDPLVVAALEAAASRCGLSAVAVTGGATSGEGLGTSGELVVAVELPGGLTRLRLEAALRRLGEEFASHEAARARVDEVRLELRPASG